MKTFLIDCCTRYLKARGLEVLTAEEAMEQKTQVLLSLEYKLSADRARIESMLMLQQLRDVESGEEQA